MVPTNSAAPRIMKSAGSGQLAADTGEGCEDCEGREAGEDPEDRPGRTESPPPPVNPGTASAVG
jgi:hypothetical protein